MSDNWNPSREEVIEGLKKVWNAFDYMEHELYADYVFDALKMLKDQEPRVLTLDEEPIKVERHMEETEWNVCGNCGSHVIHKWAYCPYCGKRLKWDD